jgi:hypothetical protein
VIHAAATALFGSLFFLNSGFAEGAPLDSAFRLIELIRSFFPPEALLMSLSPIDEAH